MQSNIQQITQQFVDRLPENDQYYRLDELRSWGFPSFIVRRIKIELERNLEESMIIPKTDWANTQSDAVLDAWQQFVDAIREEARLPASYGKTVIETAVADVMEMLVQPRKNIPNVIFRTDDQLSYDQLRERMQSVVVYPHFPKLVLRYMQKKERDSLSKDRCKQIISNADKKLTKGYSPLNWAQMLEPLFKLVDGEIDTNLLRLFYEDKQMPRVARKFDLMDDVLTRAELIEVLSSPDLLNFEGYEDDQSSLFNDQPEGISQRQEQSGLQVPDRKSRKTETTKQDPEDEESLAEEAEESKEKNDLKDEEESDEDDETLNTDFNRDDEELAENDDHEDAEEHSLNAAFKEQDEEVESEDDAEDASGSGEEKEDEVKEEDAQELETDEEEPSEEKEFSGSDPQENGREEESDEETPIWMRYMSDEEIEEYKERQQQEEQADDVEEGFIDDPIIDLTNEEASDKEVEMLRNQLSDDRDLFVEEIFRGSDRAFDQAVEEIAAYNNWSDASKYIENDIFKRNLVDMYSEAAVDFTDRLQSYFLEKQNQNK